MNLEIHCPKCGSTNVCAYLAVAGVPVEFRCLSREHGPDTFQGRNFMAVSR